MQNIIGIVILEFYMCTAGTYNHTFVNIAQD